MLKRLQVESEFVDGLRVTDQQTVEVVEMVLAGSISKSIVCDINRAGGSAIGISGKDATLIQARRLRRRKRDASSNIEQLLDLGFVGEPEYVNPQILSALQQAGMIPVIARSASGIEGETYNINADTVAGAVAAAVGAVRLLLLTDVMGVLDKQGNCLKSVPHPGADADGRGTISGGMIPKLETCMKTVEEGVDAAVILDGRVPHSVLLEVFTDKGVGTLIRRD